MPIGLLPSVRAFVAELRRRRIFRVAGAYGVVGWLLIQVVATTFPLLGFPQWLAQLVVVLVILGFAPAMVLAWAFDITSDGVTRTSPGAVRGRVALVGLLVVLVPIVGWQVVRGGERDASRLAPASAQADGSADTRPVRTLAVLPLSNLSGDAAQDYFAEGLTEELITNVARIGGIRVKSPSAVARYRGSVAPASVVARELEVDAVLEGSVVQSGDRVRVTVRLIDPAGDEQVWAEQYEAPLRDIMSLHAAISHAIAAGLQVTLTERDRARLDARRRIVDGEAYEHYLRGLSLYSRQNRVDNSAAIASLERAVARDPSFAAAHGFLAVAYAVRGFSYEPENRLTLEQRARDAAGRALALDPGSAYARLALARLLWTREHGWPHREVLAQLREAYALDPSSDHVIRQLAIIYNHIGYPERALDELRKLDVMHNVARTQIGIARSIQGRHADVLAIMQAVPPQARSGMSLSLLAVALFELGRIDDALSVLDEYFSGRSGGEPYAQLPAVRALLHAAAGRADDAERDIAVALEYRASGEFHHASYVIAQAYARLRRPDQALHWLEWTLRDGFPVYPLIARDPHLDALRGDPRFVALLAALRADWESYADLWTVR
jgi:TolB-like protein